MLFSVIMRGLTGSGKSTLAKAIASKVTSRIHSTDYYFMRNGVYQFDYEKLQENHNFNYENYCFDCMFSDEIVICDNTNIMRAEYQRYVDAAHDAQRRVIIISFPVMSIEEHIERSKKSGHDVPRAVIESHQRRYMLRADIAVDQYICYNQNDMIDRLMGVFNG